MKRKPKRKKNKVVQWTWRVVWLFLIFCVICGVIPPLFHKKAKNVADISYGDKQTAKERVRLLDDNEEALVWRLRLIEGASKEIIMSTFEMREDQSGKDIMSALNEAAKRGVKVKILVDGIAGDLRLHGSDYFKELTANENVEAKFYNPLLFSVPWKWNYRMHDKYLIADGKAYILGGRNTYDLFLGSYSEEKNEDRDVLVYETRSEQGNSYLQLLEYFQRVWELPCCKTFIGKRSAEELLEKHYEDMMKTYRKEIVSIDWMAETVATDGIALLSNPIGDWNKEPQLWKQMMKEMETDPRIIMISPYIVMNKDMYQDMDTMVKGGADIEIITNAYQSGANPFGCTDYINEKNRILKCGVKVYEYWGSHSLHTKSMLIGGNLSIVGSFNMDMRSAYLDTELMLSIKSSEINQLLRQEAQGQIDLSKCVESGKEDTYGKDYEYKTIGTDKKIIYGVLRWLIRPFRQLL